MEKKTALAGGDPRGVATFPLAYFLSALGRLLRELFFVCPIRHTRGRFRERNRNQTRVQDGLCKGQAT